jgi:hypothetical protein
MVAKVRIIRAIELGYEYLCQRKLRQSAKLSCSMMKCPKIQEVVMELEDLFSEFQVLHIFTEVKGASLNEHHLNSIAQKLLALRGEAKDYLVANGMAILKPPLWGKDNDSHEWWNVNDFEILSASYWHEVELFSKVVAPYFLKFQGKDKEEFSDVCTPTRRSVPPSSATELPLPRKLNLCRLRSLILFTYHLFPVLPAEVS